MFFKQSFVQAASLAFLAAASDIVSFKEGDNPTEEMDKFDYAIVSFYNSEEWSVEVDQLMEGAKAHLEKQIADGKWNERNSLGWFRIDIEKNPDFCYEDDCLPDQLLINNL